MKLMYKMHTIYGMLVRKEVRVQLLWNGYSEKTTDHDLSQGSWNRTKLSPRPHIPGSEISKSQLL